MAGEATRTVLFADVSGSSQLYESAGDEVAAKAIAQCMRAVREVTEAAGGELIKEIGDEAMTLFADPDSAANAATRMHLAVEALPPVGATTLALRIGFHTGAVMRRDDDLFGDTVNLASRIAGQASRGQVLMSEQTAALLAPVLRGMTRALYSVEVKGKTESVALCELVWRQSPDVTDMAGSAAHVSIGRLWLKHRGAEVTGWDSVVRIGRDKECEIVVTSDNASRQHCTIERRRDKFVLRDHSTNGTYVAVEGEAEMALHREDYILRGHGWIACGEPRAQTAEAIEYYCE
ncbi:MAG: adenylate/guanylate cyclase domain-containing protein [Betaproteobacteria bacterium]|nr:adenylate/guanylate cyclase domain-containing protein [Betaproteobacteria bacterium]